MRTSIAHSLRSGIFLFLIGLSWSTSVSAQSIVDARRVEFTPSADHNAVDANGTTLVDGYAIQVFAAGGSTPVQTASLGKPAADPDGMIRVDFVALLPGALTPGVVYEALVEAVGPGGSSGGTRTNTFSFTPTCGTPTISPTSQSFTAAAGTGSSTVTAGAGCAWTAASNVSWVSITAGATGSGNGSVSFSVAANTVTSSRTGTLTIGGRTFSVTQAAAACSFAISPTSQSVAAGGGSGTVTVTAGSGCAWTAVRNALWLSVTAGASGTGGGSVTFSAAANTGTTTRTGTLTIAGKTFTVTQPGVACTFSITPVSVLVGSRGLASGTVTVTSQAGCAWTSASNVAWITVTGSGSGNGTATYVVAENTGTVSRTGTLTVAGKTFTVQQGVKPRSPTNPRIIK